MAILKNASLILLVLLEGNCWPEIQKITKDVFVSFQRHKRVMRFGMPNLYNEFSGKIECLFEDKGFYYVDHVTINCSKIRSLNLYLLYQHTNSITANSYSYKYFHRLFPFSFPSPVF